MLKQYLNPFEFNSKFTVYRYVFCCTG